MILYLSELPNEAAVCPRGKWLFEKSQPLVFLLSRRRICREGITANVLGIGEVGAFKVQMFNLAQMFIRITNAEI